MSHDKRFKKRIGIQYNPRKNEFEKQIKKNQNKTKRIALPYNRAYTQSIRIVRKNATPLTPGKITIIKK